MAVQSYSFRLTGKTALLMHHDNVTASDRLIEWRRDPANKDKSAAGDDRSPPWTWHTYLYHDGEALCVPSDNLMVALRQAGAQIILKRQKTYKELSQSGLQIMEEFLPLTVKGASGWNAVPLAKINDMESQPFSKQCESTQALGFRLFVKRAKIGTSKHVRVRPRFDQWSLTGTIRVVRDEITPEILQQMFDIAGTVGLGDWRPGCKTPGAFGQFSAEVSA